jgi:type I restriction enzyme S subunit
MEDDGGWRDVLLEDLAGSAKNALVGGPFGSDLVQADYSSTGIPVIRGENLSIGRWVAGDFVFVPPAKAQKLSANTAGPLDIVFTQRGANHYRQVALVPANARSRFVISQSQMKLTVDERQADPLFVYYLFRSPVQQEYLQRNAIQTGVPHTNLSILRKVPLRVPAIPTQRAISHILGTLDDKIELNRRMNETLEAMARALFRSWFVDFDPVRSKAEGRDPGLPQPVADLFPDSFEDSELGEIPRGWGVASLGELIDTVKGRSYKSEELVASDTALVTLKSFARGGGYRPDGLKSFAGTYKTEQVVKPGELVFACTDVTQAAEVVGRPAIVRGTSGYRRLVASLDTLIVRPRDSSMTRAFLYFLGGTEAFVAHTYAHTTGTTVLHLAKEAIPSFTFARPSARVAEQFDALAGLALDRIQALEEESGALAALRDALLPKLISGELRVEDPARFLGGGS